MRNLLPTLLDHDPGMLAIIAHRWDVDLTRLDKPAAAETLAGVMLTPARAAAEWGRLNDAERGVLQTLLGTPGHKLAEAQFTRLFGEIRKIGPGRREREKPHLNPASVAETLYYRGLIAHGFDQGKAGMQPFVYVPGDLADVLPVHQTGFDLSAAPTAAPAWTDDVTEFEPETVQATTTTWVDDLTTLLAFIQVYQVPSEREALLNAVREGLAGHWLGQHTPASLDLLVSLAGSLGLAANENGLFKPVPAQARHWLEETRPRQVRGLAEAWRNSTLFNDLWHVPDLIFEDTGWRNDPLLARQTVLTFLEMAPPGGWWPVDDLIEMVKAEEPDFQRPAGDYESWYIRDAQTGAYLRSFDDWELVDGAVLRFILTGPMHWLGLIDVGDEGELARLTVYGRALCGAGDWPDPAEERPNLSVQSDGTILAPRTLSRYERFQVARITEWGAGSDLYTYRLTAAGLRRAVTQGLPLDAIQAFLRRTSGGALPESVTRMLADWDRAGGTEVWLSHAVVLRAATPEALQTILDTPELRRYLGAPLGPTAVIVRAGQDKDLAAALSQHGIMVDFQ